MAVGQPVPRRARTAQAPLPLPFLDATSGACRGWLFRQGEFAHDILDLEQVHQQLQWRPFYFVADSQARSLIQLRSPAYDKAQKVARLDGAVIAGRGFRRMPHGDGVFVMEIVSKTGVRDCTERWVLGCPDERTTLLLPGASSGSNVLAPKQHVKFKAHIAPTLLASYSEISNERVANFWLSTWMVSLIKSRGTAKTMRPCA
ncbi:Hypothetical Protein FCC1311_087112 [Hondaea fermentalgiana]|uniref:Uncharacterized protein n=1 Tax=Hondaea fermentalgiana TaxID=2315210 RepID=A0A2R5GNL6_9STRA|nr:Hypothetical Protein FCC1311_087112 [Hondaea fermentalgiana]|eukprot:GBG32486.1 Hypothetical Protein FCC1311_087112 [Hondaea fermentalgiana]